MIEDKLADSVLSGRIVKGATVTIKVADDEIAFDTEEFVPDKV
jgi:ATP-dependent Clp protease ATP-binding subunit ClpA